MATGKVKITVDVEQVVETIRILYNLLGVVRNELAEAMERLEKLKAEGEEETEWQQSG
jgi:hypothetical protein